MLNAGIVVIPPMELVTCLGTFLYALFLNGHSAMAQSLLKFNLDAFVHTLV